MSRLSPITLHLPKWSSFVLAIFSSVMCDDLLGQTRLPRVDAQTHAYSNGQQPQHRASPANFNYPSELNESDTLNSIPSDEFANEQDLPEAAVPQLPKGPRGAKPGVVQQLSFGTTWVPAMDAGNDYGTVDFELTATLGFPAPTRESPLLVKPGFEMHLLDGPASVGLPPRVYDEYVQFRWMRKLSDRVGLDVAITPGIHGDFKEIDSDAFRLTAHAFTSYDWTPELMVIAGVLYLDSDALNIVPAAGAIWKPDADTTYEFLIPRPRVAQRFYADEGVEKWWYIAGEYGSNQWAVTRDDGSQDVINLQDIRLLLGVERKNVANSGTSARFEIGYVFDRELEFESDTPDIRGGDTVMMRTGIWY